MPRGHCLAPGEAAEDNVEERENSEVTQFLVTGYGLRMYVQTYVRTDGRTYGQRDVEVEMLFQISKLDGYFPVMS